MSDIKAYPGIPAGICDEDLEEHMSEKGPLDAAIEVLRDVALATALCNHMPGYKNRAKLIRSAIPVLKAAGKVDKKHEKEWLNKFYDAWYYERSDGNQKEEPNRSALKSIMRTEALLEALPDQPARNAETDSATFMGMDKATELVKEKIEALPDKE